MIALKKSNKNYSKHQSSSTSLVEVALALHALASVVVVAHLQSLELSEAAASQRLPLQAARHWVLAEAAVHEEASLPRVQASLAAA